MQSRTLLSMSYPCSEMSCQSGQGPPTHPKNSHMILDLKSSASGVLNGHKGILAWDTEQKN
jgi:hypothetical protein